jgi:hypothetical protein
MSFRLWFHPESDSYYIAGEGDTDGLAEDVTGIKEHMEAAKARGIEMTDIREKLDKDAMFNALADLLKPTIVMTLHEATRTCLTCDHFREHKGEVCAKFNQRPPAKIIAFGCEHYENEIPF